MTKCEHPECPNASVAGLPKKGLLNSSAIRNILLTLLTPYITAFIAQLPILEEKILVYLPDWLDPAVHPLINGITLALVAIFGLKAMRGVRREALSAPTHIRGLYVTKKNRCKDI